MSLTLPARAAKLNAMERLRKWAIAIQVAALLLVLGILLFARHEQGEARTPAPARPKPIPAERAPEPGTFLPLPLPKEPGRQIARDTRSDARIVDPTSRDPIWASDLTKFQRRLVAGSELMKIHEELKDPKANLGTIGERLEALRPALLKADQAGRYWSAASRGDRSAWETACSSWILCRPEAVRLSNPSAGDPLGRGKHVRVWTLGERYPQAEIAAAEKLLRHIESTAGAAIKNGVDVIATPLRGDEVLPFQGGYDWAVGMYYIRDQYCTVETDSFVWFRAEVLQHEVIHAFCHQLKKDFISCRFVSEGLAEYLRFLEPDDEGFRVPPERMSNNFANLLRRIGILRQRSVDIERLQPSNLLKLPPSGLYALRHLGYPLGLAAMAFIGGAPIERAFQERSDRPIVEAIEAIGWQDFLNFVEDHARKGDAGREITVTDGDPEGDDLETPMKERRALEEALQAIGVAADNSIAAYVLALRPEVRLPDPEQTATLLEFLLAHRESLFFCADRSDAVLGSFRLAEDQEGLVEPFSAGELRASSRDGFIRNLYRAFDGGKDPVPLLGLTEENARFDVARIHAALPCTVVSMASWPEIVDRGRSHGGLNLVLCIAGRDETARSRIRNSPREEPDEAGLHRKLEEFYFRQFRTLGKSLRAALVIDLSGGEGDALPVARALARTKSFRGLIGYWDPQKGEGRR